MNCLRLMFLASISLVIAACASGSTSTSYSPECDISSLRSSDYPHATWCSIKHAALRCSTKSDKCLVQCEQNGGAKNIGGGCSYVCLSGPDSELESPEVAVCVNGAAP